MRRAAWLMVFACGCGPQPAPARNANVPPLSTAALASAPQTFETERLVAGPATPPGVLVSVLARELERLLPTLRGGEPPLYHAALGAHDVQELTIMARDGALVESGVRRWRKLDVDLRVGAPALDNTHPRPDSTWASSGWVLPVEDDELALARATWRALESARRRAEEEWGSVQAERRLGTPAGPEAPPDFDGPRPPIVHMQAPSALAVTPAEWEQRARVWSVQLSRDAHVEDSAVEIVFTATTRTLVTSEQTRLVLPRRHARVLARAATTAPDGALLEREIAWDAVDPEALPLEAISRGVSSIADDLRSLRAAPVGSPFVGPVLLEGRAAAILLHEVLGHRLEADRLRSEFEGGTFAGRIGELVMPRGLDVYDDPTLAAVNGVPLNGAYLYDDEGVPAEAARLVADGVLVGFLAGRAPVQGMRRGNGHARREPGYRPFTRQGTLILKPRRIISREALRSQLIAEIRATRSPSGLRVIDAATGMTTTERGDGQTFRIPSVVAYRVAPDGTEELVRGLALEGTPLSLIRSMRLAADSWGVFNGFCGAESGFVPVSAVSPALLVRSLEVTRSDEDSSAPPVLPRPETAP